MRVNISITEKLGSVLERGVGCRELGIGSGLSTKQVSEQIDHYSTSSRWKWEARDE